MMIDEPRIDDDLKDGAFSNIAEALAKQLGVSNDYYYPLREIAKVLRTNKQ